MEETKSTSVRMKIALFKRIQELAEKRGWSVNKWIIRTLEREANKSH